MTQETCTRIIGFDAGHRVVEHEGKCAHLHGHRYTVHITAQAEKLDGVGRVIDFSVLKDKVGGWIDEHWDHGFILYGNDPFKSVLEGHHIRLDSAERQKLYLMPFNPTAENIARYLLRSICPELLRGTGVQVVKVVVWETPNCYAEAHI